MLEFELRQHVFDSTDSWSALSDCTLCGGWLKSCESLIKEVPSRAAPLGGGEVVSWEFWGAEKRFFRMLIVWFKVA